MIELEARIMKELYTGGRCPALLLIDIKAAFPSVAWDWLWHVSDLIDCPEWLVCAVKSLYIGSTAQLATGGLRGVSIDIISGIKQRCPMSGSLWRRIFGPIIRALVEHVGEDGSLSAFADDIGVSVGDIIIILVVLVLLLGSIGVATCLKFNWKRTHIVTFSKISIFSLKTRSRRRCHWHLELRSVIVLSAGVSLLAPVPRIMLGLHLVGSFLSVLDILRLLVCLLMKRFLPCVSSPFLSSGFPSSSSPCPLF